MLCLPTDEKERQAKQKILSVIFWKNGRFGISLHPTVPKTVEVLPNLFYHIFRGK